jgi:hypothetical protein
MKNTEIISLSTKRFNRSHKAQKLLLCSQRVYGKDVRMCNCGEIDKRNDLSVVETYLRNLTTPSF